MVPAIRNILGGFLFSGDDVYKHVRVLSGGERTRLAVARMLLRPSNTLLLDEPTNHLDLDSKEVLLDALVDYGGTLIFVSHDRYFVERLATKIIEIGNGTAIAYPGHLQGVPVAQGAARGETGRTGRTAGAGRMGKARRPKAGSQSRHSDGPRTRRRQKRRGLSTPQRQRKAAPKQTSRREEARRRRGAQETEGAPSARQARIAESRGADRRNRSGDPRGRAADVRARLLRGPRRLPASHRPPPGPDVEGRRPDAPVGRASVAHDLDTSSTDGIVTVDYSCVISRIGHRSPNRTGITGFPRFGNVRARAYVFARFPCRVQCLYAMRRHACSAHHARPRRRPAPVRASPDGRSAAAASASPRTRGARRPLLPAHRQQHAQRRDRLPPRRHAGADERRGVPDLRADAVGRTTSDGRSPSVLRDRPTSSACCPARSS